MHKGHIALARTAAENIPDLNRLIVIPAAVSPFKQGGSTVSGRDRLEMCRLAFEDIPCAEVSGYEIEKGGVSYTYETLGHFSELYGGKKLYMIIGSDSLRTLPEWKNFSEIMRLCVPAAAARSQEDRQLITEYAKAVKPYGDVLIFDAEPYEISSTELRNLIAHDGSWQEYVPPKTAGYIEKYGLYKV